MTRLIWHAAGGERYLFHPTRAECAAEMLNTGIALVGSRSDYGLGFYATDLAPDAHDCETIHAELFPGWPRLWNAVVVIAVEADGRPFEEAVQHHWLIPEADRVAIGDRISGIAIFDERSAAWVYGEELIDGRGPPSSAEQARLPAAHARDGPADAQAQALADERAMAIALLALLADDQARLVRQPSLHPALSGARYPLSAGQLAHVTGATERQIARWSDLRLLRSQPIDGTPAFWPVAAATAAVLAAAPPHATATAAEIARGDGVRSIALVADALLAWGAALDGERAAAARRAAQMLGALVHPGDPARHDASIPDLLHALRTTLDLVRHRAR